MKLTEQITPDDLAFLIEMAENPAEAEIDAWMPWIVRFLAAQEERVASALLEACPGLDGRDDIDGIGLTADAACADDEIGHLPVVYVTLAELGAALPSHKALGLPEAIEFEGERLPVQIVGLAPFEEAQCIPGFPIQQHRRIRPMQPGTAIRGLNPINGNPETDGSSGALVRRRPVNPTDPVFLLSAKHVLQKGGNNLNIMQPWIGNPANDQIGATIAVSATLDAGICEVTNAKSDILCLGKPKLPIPPLISLRVQKSGAATGLTGSEVRFNRFSRRIPALRGTRNFFIDNSATFPLGGAGVTQNFAKGGDSGSMAVAGDPNPQRPNNFGRFVNALIRLVTALAPGLLAAQVSRILQRRFTYAAVGLITHTTSGMVAIPGGFQGVPVAVGLEIEAALDDLRIDLVLT